LSSATRPVGGKGAAEKRACAGRWRISRFLNDLARPHVTARDLAEGYRAMAADEEREREAAEWVENLAGDVANEPGANEPG
jgi:hypothetical protein